MSSDPRIAYDGSRILDISRDRYFQLMRAEKDLRALRLALREPSPLLVENIQVRILDTNRVTYGPTRDDIRDVLAAFLAEAVTPDEQ